VVADRLEHGEAGPVLVFPLRPHEPMAQYPCETRLIRAAPNRLDH
jgi:hypothetical protein